MPKKAAASEITFEQAFTQLEEIVERLESAELSLDESVSLFEKGQALAAQCARLLESAELKVKQLSSAGELEDFALPED
jgi:exodeoxyribonuclease VII small subunit